MKEILKKSIVFLIVFSVIISFNIVTKAENEEESLEEDYAEETYEEEEESLEEDDISDIEEDSLIEDKETEEFGEEDIEESEEETEEDTIYAYPNNLFSFTIEDITIDEIIDGDVYIISSGTVTISSIITGNIFVIAESVELSTNAEIYSSAYIVADKTNIDGMIYGNIYACTTNFTLEEDAYVNKDLFILSSEATINGYVYRDVNLNSSKITISEDAYIFGDFAYTSDNEVDIPDGVVGGETTYSESSTYESTTTFTDYLYEFVTFIIFAIVLFLVGRWMKCKFVKESQNIAKDMPKAILYGILGILIIPIIAIILLLLNVTIYVALLLAAIYCIFLFIASSIFVVTISELCSIKTKESFKTNDVLRTVCFIIVFGVIYKLLQLIPVIGAILTFVAFVMGFGILLLYPISKKENKDIEVSSKVE